MVDRTVAGDVVVRAGLIAALLLAFLAMPNRAIADVVEPANGGFNVSGNHHVHPVHAADPADSAAGSSFPPLHVEYIPCGPDGCPGWTCPDGQSGFLEDPIGPDGSQLGSPLVVCRGGGPAVTAAMVLRAFRRIPVPAPALHIEPVKGRTMVNLPTNFHAGGPHQFRRTVTLLGQRVTLRIHAQSYDFRFGDHGHLTTAEPGAPYPDLVNTHVYLRKGTVHPSLRTTWTADYRVGSGPWRSVNGSVTRATPPQDLEVTTATPVLTGS